MTWLRPDFAVPDVVPLASGHHLRPIRASDVDIDYPAVMGSRERLWDRYGDAWGWPPASMTFEADREDLTHHEREIADREAFNYAVLDAGETELLGCIYVDPPAPDSPAGTDAVVSWWVIDGAVGSALESALEHFVPRWLRETWGMTAVHWHP